jgi:hypothetical protein
VSILCSGQEAAEAVINLQIELRGLEAASNVLHTLSITFCLDLAGEHPL